MTNKFNVDGDTIVVESLPVYYIHEEDGDKRNTIRIRTAQDVIDGRISIGDVTGDMYANGKRIRNVRVINTETRAQFERELTHVCVYDDTFIYCW